MTDNDDIMLLGDLTSDIEVNDDWVFNRIDEVLAESIEKHSALIALNVGRQLREISRVSGLALAKLLYGMKISWEQYTDINTKDDTFEDVVVSYIDIHKDNVMRYANVWALFANKVVPKDLVEEISQRNIKDLIPVGLAITQGYEIDQDAWEKIAAAPDYNTVLRTVREDVKNKPPRKGSLQLLLDRDGTIWAFQDDERYFVGSLEITNEKEVVQKAINRIINGSGILRQ
jgi:hypothetical protein